MNSNTIIFSINDTYAPYLYVCLLSLLEHTQPKDKYGVYILQRNLSQQNKDHILSLAQENFNISFIDMKRFITPSMERKFALTCHFTIETYYRFFLAELFPNTDKALYLDADTLICKNIEELFQIELKKNYLAATRDVGMIYNAKQWNKKDVNYLAKKLATTPFKLFESNLFKFDLFIFPDGQGRSINFYSSYYW